MVKVIHRLFCMLFLLLFLFKSSVVKAEEVSVWQEIKKDFAPVKAFVIGKEEGNFIIDKGRLQGIKPQDIFTVYKKGKKVVHPKTGKVLGFLQKPVAKLKVFKIEENFSIAKLISKKENFSLPAIVKRFCNIKILIISKNKNKGEKLFKLLKNLLPESVVIFDPTLTISQINPDYLIAQKVDILFSVENEVIKVFNTEMNLLRIYGGKIFQSPSFLSSMKEVKVVLNPVLIKKTNLLVFQGSFMDINGDGFPEFLYFNQNGLFLKSLKGNFTFHYIPEEGKILNFSVGKNGLIALNVFKNATGMKSEILKVNTKGFQVLIKDINLILQFTNFSESNLRSVLIGQSFDPVNFFGKDIYLLKIKNKELIYEKKISLFKGYRNTGGCFCDVDEDGKPEVITYLSDGRLGIFKNNQLIWSTPYSVFTFFKNTLNYKSVNQAGEEVNVKFYPYPEPVILKSKKGLSLLFVETDFPLKGVREELKNIPLDSAKSQLMILSYRNGFFFKSLGKTYEGFIPAIGVYRNLIFFCVERGEYPDRIETYFYSLSFYN